MQDGVVLGLFGIASLVVFKWSLTIPFLSTLFSVMIVATPVFATLLTMRLRNRYVKENNCFTFSNGFLHALFTGFYASLWVALFTFVYLQYFDHGTIFTLYGQAIDTPQMKLYLQQSGINSELSALSGEQGIQGVVAAMKGVGSATYAAMSLYCAIVFGPFIAAVIGLICRKN